MSVPQNCAPDYLRKEKLPFIWCSGCGHGIVLGAILRAYQKVGWNPDETVMVSGIGCSSRAPGYVDFHTLHTTHGRSIPFATGIKLARPDLKVLVVAGDGDLAAIGGNHFIHAARRNLDLTVIMMNNHIYGMTGGQYSPTTPQHAIAATAPYGNIESPFDVAPLAAAAGAVYAARSTVFHVQQLETYIEKAMRKTGFSFVEALSACPTSYGRYNKMRTPVKLMEHLKTGTVPLAALAKLTPEQQAGKIVLGEFADRERPDYYALYQREIVAPLRGKESS